jgi:hypothetical protein
MGGGYDGSGRPFDKMPETCGEGVGRTEKREHYVT